ncbi:MAG: hypothetical protein AAF327_19260 [Cyanobacteria bacterium P01_A01_bin.37]
MQGLPPIPANGEKIAGIAALLIATALPRRGWRSLVIWGDRPLIHTSKHLTLPCRTGQKAHR